MLRSNTAKQWKPDPPGKLLMERIIRFDLAAQHASQPLRLCDQHALQPTSDQTPADFQGDPIQYPFVMAPVENPKERKSFQLKCEKFCFPESEADLEDRDYILMYFAAQAGMQSLFAQDCHAHSYGAEIEYRANAHVVKPLGRREILIPQPHPTTYCTQNLLPFLMRKSAAVTGPEG